MDKAASPVFKVIDALACGGHGPGVRMCLAERLVDLGIDPDMDTETLRQRLLWGERVEQLERRHVPTRLGEARHEALVTNSVRDWLTRRDITEDPVPP